MGYAERELDKFVFDRPLSTCGIVSRFSEFYGSVIPSASHSSDECAPAVGSSMPEACMQTLRRVSLPLPYTSSPEEEEDAQKRPCGKALESRIHTVKEGRDVLEKEMRNRRM